jgi:hypothetical protein
MAAASLDSSIDFVQAGSGQHYLTLKISWSNSYPNPTPNQTKPNQTKPNQTKPNQTKPNQTKFWAKKRPAVSGKSLIFLVPAPRVELGTY